MGRFLQTLFPGSRGMFREFIGINAFLSPQDPSLYEWLLPKPFLMPERPVVMLFVADYLKVSPWPMTRYQEWAVSLKCIAGAREAWHVLTMPVTKRVPMIGGRYLGFPKYLAESITLMPHGNDWRAQGRYKNRLEINVEFQRGLTRTLAPWEEEILADKAFFKGDACLLVPPGKGPRAQRVRLEHKVPAEWTPEIGMVRVDAERSRYWSGLFPKDNLLVGTFTRFRGGIDLVAESLGA